MQSSMQRFWKDFCVFSCSMQSYNFNKPPISEQKLNFEYFLVDTFSY